MRDSTVTHTAADVAEDATEASVSGRVDADVAGSSDSTRSAVLSPQTLEKLKHASVATITTCLYRAGVKRASPTGIGPLSKGQPRMVGVAFTLRFIPARDDVGGISSYGGPSNVHQQAFELCPVGGVLVMDTRGETRGCSCGDLLIGRLKARGCSGIVTDGGFRDTPDIERLHFPAYQRMAVPSPSFGYLQAVETNVPVGCGDIAVYPGDVIVGDSEGIVVIPSVMVDKIADDAFEQTQYDDFAAREVARGRTVVGLYPATPQSLADYAAWQLRGGAQAEDQGDGSGIPKGCDVRSEGQSDKRSDAQSTSASP